jgi:hypothetical protein
MVGDLPLMHWDAIIISFIGIIFELGISELSLKKELNCLRKRQLQQLQKQDTSNYLLAVRDLTSAAAATRLKIIYLPFGLLRSVRGLCASPTSSRTS